MFGHNHSHSHGGQPCHGHHGGGHGQQQGFRSRSNFNVAPMIPGTNMTRQSCGRIVSPTAVGLMFFTAYTIYYHIYGCDLSSNFMAIPLDGYLWYTLFIITQICFARGAFSSPGLVSQQYIDEHKERVSLLRNQQMQQMKQMQQNMNLPNGNNNNNQNDEKTEELHIDPAMVRPPRSHYCFELQSNVLRHDHYCLWFNNAVGFYNYKHFMLVLVYLFVGCPLGFLIIIYRLILPNNDNLTAKHTYGFNKSPFIYVLHIFCIFVSLLCLLLFSIFSFMHLKQHLWQVSKGLTSIEYHQYFMQWQQGRHFGIKFHETHVYDHGSFYKNAIRFFGTDWYLWLLPTTPVLPEDGYKFDINNQAREKIIQYAKLVQEKQRQMWKNSNFAAFRNNPMFAQMQKQMQQQQKPMQQQTQMQQKHKQEV